MQNIIFALVSFLIAAFAFGFGAAKLFKKKKPLYLQLLVCAAGCFAIQQLSNARYGGVPFLRGIQRHHYEAAALRYAVLYLQLHPAF